MFAFHHVRNVFDSPGQSRAFRLGGETAPAGLMAGAVIPLRQARLATSRSYSRLLEQWPDISARRFTLAGPFFRQISVTNIACF